MSDLDTDVALTADAVPDGDALPRGARRLHTAIRRAGRGLVILA